MLVTSLKGGDLGEEVQGRGGAWERRGIMQATGRGGQAGREEEAMGGGAGEIGEEGRGERR